MSDQGKGGTVGIAELFDDRGAAAESDEFFRSRPFLDAESVTHTLRIEAGELELVAPLIVRDVPDRDLRDAISPYGYPGIAHLGGASDIDHTRAGSISDAPIDPLDVDWSATGLVAVFLRHTLDPPPLAGATERNVVQIADPGLPAKSRASDRNRINRNRRDGYVLELLPGPETSAEQRAGFLAVYEETMRRAEAAERYFFTAAYFDRILESDRSWLALARAPGGEVAAASIAVRSDGFLHYYLSGSADAHLRASPMKNVVARLIELTTELNLPLNLGGGISRGDRLEEFKRGFANREMSWHISELICKRETYDRLSAGLPSTGFFPKYRSS